MSERSGFRLPTFDSRPDHVKLSLADSFAYCRDLAKRRAGNFYFSFLTLPRERFRAMCALYGFMRVCDDIGDAPGGDADAKTARLREWRSSLERALDGDCSGHEVFPALVDVVNRYAIPAEYLHAVIDGVESDLRPRVFDTFDELSRYCYRVAGAVGLCCVHVWGFRDERAIPRAIDCGTAFQLTNILRDLGEDAAMGRVYLPREDLARFGLDASDLAGHCRDERFTELMRFEVDRARSYYAKARELFDYVDRPGKPILAAMLRIYGGLLDEIERRGYDVFTRRVSLSRGRKLRIALGAMLRYRLFGR
jgi:phytoene synthase